MVSRKEAERPRTESNNRTPQGPLRLPPFTAFNQGSPKLGSGEAEEGDYQDGWGNKVRIKAGGGPEVAHPSSRLTDSRVTPKSIGRIGPERSGGRNPSRSGGPAQRRDGGGVRQGQESNTGRLLANPSRGQDSRGKQRE